MPPPDAKAFRRLNQEIKALAQRSVRGRDWCARSVHVVAALQTALAEHGTDVLLECVFNADFETWTREVPLALADEALYDAALQALDFFEVFDPDFLPTYRGQRAIVLARSGRTAEADAVLAANLQSWPADPFVLFDAAKAYQALGRPAEAEALLRKLTLKPSEFLPADVVLPALQQVLAEQGQAVTVEELRQWVKAQHALQQQNRTYTPEELQARFDHLSFQTEPAAPADLRVFQRYPEATRDIARAALQNILDAAASQDLGSEWGALYALLFLGELRDRESLPLALALLRLPKAAVEMLLGDALGEFVPRVLAGLAGEETAPLVALVLDEDAYLFSRGAALAALLVLVNQGDLARDELVGLHREIFGKLARKPSTLWSSLTFHAAVVQAHALWDDVKQAYADALPQHADPLSTLERELEGPSDMLTLTPYQPLTATWIDELEAHPTVLGSIHVGDESEEAWPLDRRLDEHLSPAPAAAAPKVGRNDPCPCGSGKKSKKCCGAR
jgi:hypothetical protein